MADFVEDSDLKEGGEAEAVSSSSQPAEMIDYESPMEVIYCPTCTMPPEFCEHGSTFDECLPWILDNCPEVLGEEMLAKMMRKASLEEGEEPEKTKKEKKKGGGAAPLKKAAATKETKIVMTRVQRQKRKYVTVIAGLETVPDLKIKDATKLFGKKFSSGASVNEAQGGGKEVVIQGDVLSDLPALLMSEFKVSPSAIFILEDGALRQYQ